MTQTISPKDTGEIQLPRRTPGESTVNLAPYTDYAPSLRRSPAVQPTEDEPVPATIGFANFDAVRAVEVRPRDLGELVQFERVGTPAEVVHPRRSVLYVRPADAGPWTRPRHRLTLAMRLRRWLGAR